MDGKRTGIVYGDDTILRSHEQANFAMIVLFWLLALYSITL
jgi:hypothetical protein